MELMMELKTILNKVTNYKTFVFGTARFEGKSSNIIVPISPRKNSKGICSKCKTASPGYDKLELRLFQFIGI